MLSPLASGLDSASTLALCQSMRRSAKLLNTTVVMALLQPEPAVVDLFDDIVLLAEGKVRVYVCVLGGSVAAQPIAP